MATEVKKSNGIVPKKMKLTKVQLFELFEAYQQFGGYNKTVGEDKSVIVPYDLGGLTRVAIAMNATTLRPIVTAHREAVDALREQHIPDGFDPKKATPEERAKRIAGMTAFQAEVKKLDAVEVEVEQREIKLDDLKPDVNPLDPSILICLAPVLVE